jgi:hypothetical protein
LWPGSAASGRRIVSSAAVKRHRKLAKRSTAIELSHLWAVEQAQQSLEFAAVIRSDGKSTQKHPAALVDREQLALVA